MYSTRPTSKYEMYVPWWTMPIRSVSPNRTRTTWRDTQWAGRSLFTGARDNTSEPRAKQSSPCRLVLDPSCPRRQARTRRLRSQYGRTAPGGSGSRGPLAPTSDRDGQDRDGRQAHQLFCNAPQEEVGEARSAMGAQYHQVVLALLQFGQSGRRGLARDQAVAGGNPCRQTDLAQELGHVPSCIFADQLADGFV